MGISNKAGSVRTAPGICVMAAAALMVSAVPAAAGFKISGSSSGGAGSGAAEAMAEPDDQLPDVVYTKTRTGGSGHVEIDPTKFDPDLLEQDSGVRTDKQPEGAGAASGYAVPSAGVTAPPGGRSSALTKLNDDRVRARLPDMPGTPVFSASLYPNCREDFQRSADALAKVETINRCTVALDKFYSNTMVAYRKSMIAHQDTISKLYTDKVGGNPVYTPDMQSNFFRAMRQEHAASNPDGAHFGTYRSTEQRYNADRKYLQQQYCRYAGTC